MANIEDVAKKAKVSVTTVSRALNDHPYVSEKTKKKIFKAMEDLNYYPNNVAQQLRGKKKKMIGIIISYITNPFFAYLVDAVEKKALECGYTLVVLQTQEKPELEQFYVELIQKKQLDGLIISNLENATNELLQLIDQGKVVLCNRYIGNEHLPVITIDEELASYEGTQLLLKKGHRNIAFCTGNIKNNHDLRFKGFLRALQDHDIIFQDDLFYENILGITGGRTFIHEFRQRSIIPTAVFSNGDEVAAGMISESRRLNIGIPDDLAILGFDDQPIASLTNPEITTIRQPIEEIGVLATETLIAKLENEDEPSIIPLKTTLIERESV